MSWTKVVLGECVNITSGPAFKSCEFTSNSSDIPLVKGENVGQGIVLWEKSKYWPRNDLLGYEKFKLEPGDVVLAMDRPWVSAGLKYAVISERDPQALLVQRVARIRAINGLETRFLRHIIASPQFCAYIKGIMGGTNVPHISGDQIRAFSVTMPPIQIQQRIADILSAYDDLIENNRRRIQLLEQSARLLYKEWFVHLRFPGHEHVPVVDGVPKGWGKIPLGECAKFLSGGTPSKAKPEFWEGDIPWVSSGELKAMRIHRTKLNITGEAISAGSRLVPKETILAVVRGMSLAKDFRIGVTARPMAFNQDIKALKGEHNVDTLFLFHAIDSQRNGIRDLAADASHGTKKLDMPVLLAIPILVPPPTIQAVFRQILSKLHDQWDVLDNANVRLQEARDLLLPRLMSGEIPV